MLHDVGAVEEFEEGRIALVEANRREIGILRWRGAFFAVRNVCPHLGAPLCSGPAVPKLSATAELDADPTVDPDQVLLVCPWHRWEFDARTGHSLVPSMRVKTYPVVVQHERVYIETDS